MQRALVVWPNAVRVRQNTGTVRRNTRVRTQKSHAEHRESGKTHSGALVETVKHNAERVREDRGRGKSEHWEWKSYRI